MSEILGVGRSSYYKWLKNKGAAIEKEAVLNKHIKTAFEKSRSTYGSPRVYIELQKMGIEQAK